MQPHRLANLTELWGAFVAGASQLDADIKAATSDPSVTALDRVQMNGRALLAILQTLADRSSELASLYLEDRDDEGADDDDAGNG